MRTLEYAMQDRTIAFEIVAAPLDFVALVLPVLAAIWLVWRLKPGINLPDASKPSPAGEEQIKCAVHSVFNSEHFLTALRTSLPRGEDDVKYGFDFIPFMLQSIDERRRSFQRSATIFFWVTISVGILFALTIATFGYILVNEEAIGTPKRVKSLEQAASEMRARLEALSPISFPNNVFDDLCQKSLNELQRATPPQSLTTNGQRISDLIQSLSHQEDVAALVDAVQKQAAAAITLNEKAYRQLAENAVASLAKYQRSYEAARTALPNALDTLTSATKEVRGKLDENRNQLTELLRRVCIGLVVASFFLALLRYVASLYRQEYEQVRLAYEDDLALRRFYVAYKSSEGSTKDRSAAIAALVNAKAVMPSIESGDALGLNKAEADVLKELLNSLSKKIS